MWTRQEQERTPASSSPTPASAAPGPAASIGRSVVMKGELTGSEDLVIDGQVEGTVNLRQHHRHRENRNPRERLGRRGHQRPARGDCGRGALSRKHRHASA
jgi:hypothetical protein